MDLTDAQCIEACRQGSTREYRLLVERHQVAVAAFVSGRGEARARAEEVTQEAFARAFFSLGKLRAPSAFLSWVLGIAERVRLEQRREDRPAPVVPGGEPSSVRDSLEAEESDRALRQAIAEIPELYRELILLRFYRGLSCAEIASQRQVPLGSVTKQLSRAYGLLRELLERIDQPVVTQPATTSVNPREVSQ